MTILIVGASGATGRLLIKALLNKGESVKVIVRSLSVFNDVLSDKIQQHPFLTVLEDDLLTMSDMALKYQVQDCRAVISCLGHNLTFKGMFGQPRRLVTDATKRLCHAIKESTPTKPVKFILMNTTGNQNKRDGEQVSMSQSVVVSMIRCLLPAHADNEDAAEFLQHYLGRDIDNNKHVEWVVVRPDSLTDEAMVSEYEVFTAPMRSAIFDAGKTSRINVAHFMTQLVFDTEMWEKWQTKMPVIYNL